MSGPTTAGQMCKWLGMLWAVSLACATYTRIPPPLGQLPVCLDVIVVVFTRYAGWIGSGCLTYALRIASAGRSGSSMWFLMAAVLWSRRYYSALSHKAALRHIERTLQSAKGFDNMRHYRPKVPILARFLPPLAGMLLSPPKGVRRHILSIGSHGQCVHILTKRDHKYESGKTRLFFFIHGGITSNPTRL